MSFVVTVRAAGRVLATYPAIGNSFDLHAAAIDRFGPCTVSVLRSA